MFAAEVFERLAKKHPEAVMVRAVMEQAMPPGFVDDVFKRTASAQYTRKLLFSTLVRLLSLVVCRVRSSMHACIVAMQGELCVTTKSIYNKLNGTETKVAEALLSESAARMADVVDAIGAPLPPLIPGWETRILDGNHLAATDHRPAALRTIGGGALPGLALVVYDAQRGLVDRAYLCEDGHAQEREPLVELLGEMGPGEVWIADRNFGTCTFLIQTHASGSRFIVRRHASNGRIREAGPWRTAPRDAADGLTTGVIEERAAFVESEYGETLSVRLIRVRLDKKTRDGERVIELVSDLEAEISATTIAAAYRARWRIETAFAELDRVFEGEISSLAQPRAALLAFTLALVAFNTLGVVQAALRKKHGAAKIERELSKFHLGESVQRADAALEVFLDASDWTARYAALTPRELAAALVRLADHVNLGKLKKHPRGPKKPAAPRKHDPAHPHVSTARILANQQQPTRRRTAKPKR